MAMWQHEDTLWVYMGEKMVTPRDLLVGLSFVKNPTFYQHDQGISLHLDIPLSFRAALIPSRDYWILEIAKAEPEEEASSPLAARLESSPAELAFFPLSMEPVHKWVDPLMGLTHFIMPMKVRAHMDERLMGSVKLLTTQQGIVIQLYDVGIIATTADKMFKLHKPAQDLNVSNNHDKLSNRVVGTPKPLVSLKGFEGNYEAWNQYEQEYIHKLIQLKPSQRTPLRFKLVRFYLATDCFAEAISMLDVMLQENPALEQDPVFLVYQGIAYTLNLQPDRAQASFNHPSLILEPEVDLWKGVGFLVQQDYQKGLAKILHQLPIIKRYPKTVKNFICFQAAKGAMRLGYPGEILLNFIDYASLSSPKQDMYNLLKISLSKAPEVMAKRLDVLTHLSKSKHAEVAAEAKLEILKGQPTRTAGDEETLNNLRFLWRGDHTEMKVLTLYADTLLKFNKPFQALKIMRQINEYGKGYPEHSPNLTQAHHVFFKTFMEFKGSSPLELIALFHSLEELLPLDERGERMLLRLVDYYEDLNLLQRATDILKGYIKKQAFKPLLYKEALLKLARLLLGRKEYEEALTTLNNLLALPDLPDPQRHLAVLLQAKALAEKDQLPQALSLLHDDSNPEILALKFEILWQKQEWAPLIPVLEKLLEDPSIKAVDKPRYAVALAVALNHTESTEQIKQLRQQYEKTVRKSPYEAAFMLLTAPDVKAETHYREAIKELSEIKNFDTFLKDFRKKSNAP